MYARVGRIIWLITGIIAIYFVVKGQWGRLPFCLIGIVLGWIEDRLEVDDIKNDNGMT